MSEPAGTASGAPWHRTQPWKCKEVARRRNRMQLTFLLHDDAGGR